jgi:transposase
MWEGFTSAIKELFVNAKIVYDRFHVMKNINEELNELRKRMNVHVIGICNYFENRTTNGLIEGMNTKIKLIKRKSYGFANFEHLRLKLLAYFNF